jgi:carbon storage regulator CsrA
MLVLSRRTSDKILIPSLGITLEVLSIKGNVVRLGISAPQEVRILRGELTGTEPRSAEAPSAAERVDEKVPMRSSSLKKYLQRTDKPETDFKSATDSVAVSRSANVPVLFLPEESPEAIRENAATYEVCT